MATVAGGGERLRRRRRLPLADLTNLSFSTSTSRPKATAQSKPCNCPSASSCIGSSTAPRTRCPPPPPPLPPPPPPSVAEVKGKGKPRRELQCSSCHLKKIKKISKPKAKTGDMLPGSSSPLIKKTRKRTNEEQLHMEPLDGSVADSLPSQNFIEEQRAYFAEIDAFELVEEFISSGSDLE